VETLETFNAKPKLRRKEMKKKGLFTIFGMVLAFSLLAAPVWAYDINDHVAVAPNLEGDVLVYPLYIALDGLSTNFQVINTSPTLSTVVKIVLRSHQYSQEVLDFLIFLSHNDVFNGTIFYSGGQYKLTSSDGSLCLPNGTCASAAAPLTFTLTPPCAGNADSEAFGYIMGIEAWAGLVADDPADPGTVKKADIQAAYQAAKDAGLDECSTADIITGNAKLDFVGTDISGYEADTLRNYRNLEAIDVANETILGAHANNNLCEIEAALSKNFLAVPYYNNASILVATLPTKLATCPDASGHYTAKGPFFDVDTNLSPGYSAIFFDDEEHSFATGCVTSPCTPEKKSLPDETNLLVMSSNYPEGWGRFTFTTGGSGDAPAVTDCTDLNPSAGVNPDVQYYGAPLVSLIAHFTPDGFVMARPAYRWSEVDYDTDYDNDFDQADDGFYLEGEYQLTPGPAGGVYRICVD
jgi:hypothetical protein